MFHLRFDPSKIPYWAERYVARSRPEDVQRETDLEREVVPAARGRGYLTKAEFLSVARWKSPRPTPRYEQNSDDFIEAATHTAFSTPSEQLRIEVLTLLSGVNWPVASAILHWTHPDPYPILDVRALWSVGWSQNAGTTAFTYEFDDWPLDVPKTPFVYDFSHWWGYTVYCRQLRQQSGVTMRDLDRALWQYAKEHMP